jgi:hypothetical protein
VSERSERTISTGFGEAPCAEPLIGAAVAAPTSMGHGTIGGHR